MLEGYFEITTDQIGGKWDLIKFTCDDGSSLAVRIGDDKKNPLVYNISGGSDISPEKSFVWKQNTTYSVYFKISNGTITVNISNGSSVYALENIAISGTVRGAQMVSGNKGQRHTSIDNVVICAS